MPGSLSILRFAGFKPLFAAFALLFVLANPATAQLSFKPTAEAVQEDKLLNALKEGDKISGRVSIPDGMAASLPAATGATSSAASCRGSAALPFSECWPCWSFS
jgi:formate dehydrogenase subunit gamma